jgi:predicted DNA-binding mobile mystery protein A
MTKRLKQIQLQNLDNHFKKMCFETKPKNGWIKTIRQALSMPLAFVANKLNISEQSVNQLENNEAFETISLKSLRRLAEAIDCELHYAIIPRERSLQKIIKKRAEFKARLIIKEVNKTMELEDQKIENSENSVKLLTKDFAENLNKNLWRNDEN